MSKKIAVIGKPGVGKSMTIEKLFHPSEVVADVVEGTNAMIEVSSLPEMSIVTYAPIYTIDGNAEVEYEKLYNAILVDCDVVVYVINAASRNNDEDCRILKDIIIPVCKANGLCDNLFVAFNKIDVIGEMENPNDSGKGWDIINNRPTDNLKNAIKVRLNDLIDKIIEELFVGNENSIQPDHVTAYSAVFEYNLNSLKKSFKKNERDGIWGNCDVLSRIGKWSTTRDGLIIDY